MAGRGGEDVESRRGYRVLSALQLLLSVLPTIVITSALGWVMAGPAGIFWALLGGGWALLGGGVLILLKFKLSPRRILKQLGARPLSAHVAPGLNDLLDGLAQRAGLPATPALHYVPSTTVNAFAVGSRHASAVAITDSMLRAFSPREIAGVFAHEVSHVRINDLWLMAFADLLSRVTRLLSIAGQILLLLNLPLLLTHGVSWSAILILVFLPLMSVLIQFSLSRTREYNADLGAVELTGDPRGLMLALEKMERQHRQLPKQILRPLRSRAKRSLLRTHPLTAKRIERLRRLQPVMARVPHPHAGATLRQAHPGSKRHAPEHLNGLRY